MSGLRFKLIVLGLVIVCASQLAAWQGNQSTPAKSGPTLGKWKFTAKETSGVVWTGTLILSKIDPQRFSPDKYHSLCNIEAVSTKGGLGVEHPAAYDPSTRVLSLGHEGGNWGGSTYTAVLSADGKKLEKGKWKQSDREFESRRLSSWRAETGQRSF